MRHDEAVNHAFILFEPDVIIVLHLLRKNLKTKGKNGCRQADRKIYGIFA